MYKKYNCPYQRPCYPTCTFKYGPTHCSYKDCEDCPYFKESKAWSGMGSFFEKKKDNINKSIKSLEKASGSMREAL